MKSAPLLLALLAVAEGVVVFHGNEANSSICQAQDQEYRARLQEKLAVFDVKCEAMCRKIGAYPDCQCPGFEGNPSSDGDTRKCMDQYCQDPKTPCPTDAFVTCVKEATKISALQWSALMQGVDDRLGAFVQRAQAGKVDAASCQAADKSQRALLQEKLAVFDVKCEDMCRKIGAYPDCQCPGFEGNPSSDDDTRKCMVQYCQDPKTPCPTDAFVTCVKEATKISALQWSALMQGLDSRLAALTQMRTAKKGRKAEASSCQEKDKSHRALLQEKLAVFDVKCEDMCRKIGAYPNCQCPGFEGNPSSDDDTRKCMDQYCQDPRAPCPTDAFVTCVREATKVSALQWSALMQRADASLTLFKQMAANARKQK